MTIILGNLIDNAVAACINHPGSHITLKIHTLDNAFTIHLATTYIPEETDVTPDNVDSIDFIHGYGLKNVKNSVKMFNGICHIAIVDYEYQTTIVVPI